MSQSQPDEAELPRGLLSCKPDGNEEMPNVMSALMDKQGQLTQPKKVDGMDQRYACVGLQRGEMWEGPGTVWCISDT